MDVAVRLFGFSQKGERFIMSSHSTACIARASWHAASSSADPIIFSLWVSVNEFSRRSKVTLLFPGVHPSRTTFPLNRKGGHRAYVVLTQRGTDPSGCDTTVRCMILPFMCYGFILEALMSRGKRWGEMCHPAECADVGKAENKKQERAATWSGWSLASARPCSDLYRDDTVVLWKDNNKQLIKPVCIISPFNISHIPIYVEADNDPQHHIYYPDPVSASHQHMESFLLWWDNRCEAGTHKYMSLSMLNCCSWLVGLVAWKQKRRKSLFLVI